MRNEKLILKIIEKVMRLNALGQHSFFRFHGHVKSVNVEVCKKKWKDIDYSKYNDYEEAHLIYYRIHANAYTSDTKKLKEIIEKLEEIEKEVM